MPTTARLIGAILMAGLGYFIAELIRPYVPDEHPIGYFPLVAAGFGLLIGWSFTGRRLDRRQGTGLGIGIASIGLLVMWVTLAVSGYEMLQRSLRRLYDGPTDALQGMVQIAVEYLGIAAKADVIIAAILGGLAVGLITGWVARTFR